MVTSVSLPFAQPFQANGHLLTQAYSNEPSNFGPMYHSHSSFSHTAYSSPYEKYKLSPPAHANSTYSPGTYQGFYPSTHPHQMMRSNSCIDYVPR